MEDKLEQGTKTLTTAFKAAAKEVQKLGEAAQTASGYAEELVSTLVPVAAKPVDKTE